MKLKINTCYYWRSGDYTVYTCFSTKHVLPCWILQIEYLASKSGILCFSGWIPDSMLLVSTWILTKIQALQKYQKVTTRTLPLQLIIGIKCKYISLQTEVRQKRMVTVGKSVIYRILWVEHKDNLSLCLPQSKVPSFVPYVDRN